MADPKANKKAADKVVKKKETVRERAEKASTTAPKGRRVKQSVGTAGKPFRAVGRFLAKVLRPLGFLLKPFRTRPARFIGRVVASILLFRFFRDAWKELRQVVWPNAKETMRLTFAVFAFAIVFGLIVAIVDYGLDKVFRKVFLQ